MARHIEKIRLDVTSHSVRASQAVLQYGAVRWWIFLPRHS